MYWNRYKGRINGKYLNKKHNQYVEWHVYECLYMITLMTYYSNNKYDKLKYQSIDSTFITNLYGSEMYGRNVKYKSKNGIKISTKVDNNGVANSIAFASGNLNDVTILKEQINYELIETNSKKVMNNNKYKQYILGDSGYYVKEIKKSFEKKGYTVITDVNKRGAKKKSILEKINNDKKKYITKQVKRLPIERSYSWIKKYPKLLTVVEKTTKSYKGLFLLAYSKIVGKKIMLKI
jgi:hypothetical protein